MQPWLSGELELQYTQLERLLIAMVPDARITRLTSDRPNHIVTTDGRLLPIDSPETPYAVLHWPARGETP